MNTIEPLIRHIMIIDDDSEDVQIFSEALNNVSTAVRLIHVKSLEDAMHLLPEHPLPDLIILDWSLPIYGGNECLKHIKSVPSIHHIPVAIYSTTVVPFVIQQAFEGKASLVIEKPADFSRLQSIIETLLTKMWTSEAINADEFVIK